MCSDTLNSTKDLVMSSSSSPLYSRNRCNPSRCPCPVFYLIPKSILPQTSMIFFENRMHASKSVFSLKIIILEGYMLNPCHHLWLPRILTLEIASKVGLLVTYLSWYWFFYSSYLRDTPKMTILKERMKYVMSVLKAIKITL